MKNILINPNYIFILAVVITPRIFFCEFIKFMIVYLLVNGKFCKFAIVYKHLKDLLKWKKKKNGEQ